MEDPLSCFFSTRCLWLALCLPYISVNTRDIDTKLLGYDCDPVFQFTCKDPPFQTQQVQKYSKFATNRKEAISIWEHKSKLGGHWGILTRDLEDRIPKLYQTGHQSIPESPQKYFRLVPQTEVHYETVYFIGYLEDIECSWPETWRTGYPRYTKQVIRVHQSHPRNTLGWFHIHRVSHCRQKIVMKLCTS